MSQQGEFLQEIPFSSIEGIIIGHCTNEDEEEYSDQQTNTTCSSSTTTNKTNSGCTVILSQNPEGFACGVDCRGGATGTRETDLLKPGMLVEKIHACVISGGSAFGLDASSGVMKFLREQGIGYHTDVLNVPIVCQAVLYDLQMLKNEISNSVDLPNYFQLGYKACKNGKFNSENGNIGAGNGATIGKLLGEECTMKGGLGSFAYQMMDSELKIGAMVAVNCFGDVYENGNLIAGCYKRNSKKEITFLDSEKILIEEYLKSKEEANAFELSKRNQTKHDITNTTIGIVVTNAILDKSQLNRIAMMAHDGYARSMKPSHTLYDGDTIFVVATGTINVRPPTNLMGTLAAQVVERAVVNGVKHARTMRNFVSLSDLIKE